MGTPAYPKASSLAPSCGHERREEHFQRAHRRPSGGPLVRSPSSALGVHHISSARRPRLLDPASPVGAAAFGHVWLDGGSTGAQTALAALDVAL